MGGRSAQCEMDSSIAMMMRQSWIFFDYHLAMKVKEILQFIFPINQFCVNNRFLRLSFGCTVCKATDN